VQDITPENKLRLLMVYAGVHPEKFEGEKGLKLMQVIACSLSENSNHLLRVAN